MFQCNPGKHADWVLEEAEEHQQYSDTALPEIQMQIQSLLAMHRSKQHRTPRLVAAPMMASVKSCIAHLCVAIFQVLEGLGGSLQLLHA